MIAYRDKISAITGYSTSGIRTIHFESGRQSAIESGFGMRQLFSAFDNPIGQEIVWTEDEGGLPIMGGFVSLSEWTGSNDWDENNCQTIN